jgi:hypothetical protein
VAPGMSAVEIDRETDAPLARDELASLVGVARELVLLDQRLASLESDMRASIERVPLDRRESARNLVHYVALRQQDRRELQVDLAQLGLSEARAGASREPRR